MEWDGRRRVKSRNVDMHVCGESDGLIVPVKRANKAGGYTLAAESAEGRRSTKGNAPQAHSCRTQSRGSESQRLWCVRQAAKSGWPSHKPEVRAVWGNSSRTDLCGGPLARAVPTATDSLTTGTTASLSVSRHPKQIECTPAHRTSLS